ncbi:MAG: MBL fold metallo-hydrolase [Prevotella sp.]|jgi:hydroxyacylglutathione hydrolase|nr:MBL fold metallo-hydrolase [Prevotella sp.]
MVSPQVVLLKMSYKFMINYSYLIIDNINHCSVIVDPAWDIEKINKTLVDNQTDLNGVLLTHSHEDHTHLAIPLAQKYNCPIWMSSKEIDESGFLAPQLVPMDIMIPWSIGQIHIQPILTPGHTGGSVCYLIGDNLFTGDTLFAEGCGICPNLQSAHMMFTSLQNLKNMLDPDVHVYPGHSYGKPPGLKFSDLLQDNIYLQFANERDFAKYRLRKGQNESNFFTFY